ncbi:hypothetical protein NMG60_11013382 [Bertholletia excelsa]
MPLARRSMQVLQSSHLMNTFQILRESIRILQLHPSFFHSVSIFLFSPLPISLFISHFLLHSFPQIPSSMLKLTDHPVGQTGELPLPKLLPKTIAHVIMCLPSVITFSLLGRAATIQAVSDNYNGIVPDRRRIFIRSGLSWVKLVHTSFWEFIIILSLFGVLITCLFTVPNILFAFGVCSKILGFWGVLGFLGIPFCLAFAHVTVLGSLARVLSVLECGCFGLESLMKARKLMKGRRQTALVITLVSNVGFRLIECLFEFRMCKGMSLWEGPVLVSMYSMVLVLDTVMAAVFYYACKPWDSMF